MFFDLFHGVFVIFALSAGLLYSQVDRSSLAGTVLDPSGKAVPNVVIHATNRSTGIERTTSSNNKGIYAMNDLPTGSWSVVFTARGFSDLRYENVEQMVGQERTLSPVLSLAVHGNQTTVSDSVAALDQSSSTLSDALEQKAIQDLALNGRNWSKSDGAHSWRYRSRWQHTEIDSIRRPRSR